MRGALRGYAGLAMAEGLLSLRLFHAPFTLLSTSVQVVVDNGEGSRMFKRLALCMLLAVFLSAQPGTTTQTFTWSSSLFNPCTGTYIQMTLTETDVFRVNVDSAGQTHLRIKIQSQITGVDDVGVEWNGVERTDVNYLLTPGGNNGASHLMFHDSLTVTSATGQMVYVRSTFHATVLADGSVTAQREGFRVECQ